MSQKKVKSQSKIKLSQSQFSSGFDGENSHIPSTSKWTPSPMASTSKWTSSQVSSMKVSQPRFNTGVTQTQQTLENTTQVNIDDISADIILVLLATQHSLKPMKKSTLIKQFKKLSGKLYNDVMSDVKTKLLDIFGLRLVEIEDKTVSYILVNDIPTDLELTGVPLKPILEENKMIILLLVLTVIYKNGGQITEDELLMFLKNSQIIVDVEKPVGKGKFSEIEVDKFLKQELTGMLYLTRSEIVRDSNESLIEYRWGRRAEEEVNYQKLDKFYKSVDKIPDGEARII